MAKNSKIIEVILESGSYFLENGDELTGKFIFSVVFNNLGTPDETKVHKTIMTVDWCKIKNKKIKVLMDIIMGQIMHVYSVLLNV